MERLDSLQGIRGAAVLGVVLFHMAAVEAKYAAGDQLLPDWVDFFQLGVDLFFIISGFVMVIVTRGRFQDWGEGRRFLFNRVSRIYPNYWLYYSITLIAYLIFPGMVNTSHGESNLLASFLLWPSDRVLLVMVAWSLVFELWFYLVFCGFLAVRERFLVPLLVLWAVGLILFNATEDWRSGVPVLQIVLHPYALEFIVGCLIARFFYSSRSRQVSASVAWTLLGLAVLVGVPLLMLGEVQRAEGLARMLQVGAVFGAVVLALALLERLGQIRAPRVLVRVGDMSYTVYLSHLLVMGVLGRCWAWAGGSADTLLDNLFWVVVMMTCVLAYGWLAYRWFEQPVLAQTTAFARRRLRQAQLRDNLGALDGDK